MRSAIALLLIASTALADVRSRAHNLPDVSPELIDVAVDAAMEFETSEVDAAMLMALCWGESRCNPAVRTGNVCGALQVNPTDLGDAWSCEWLEIDMRSSFSMGARELAMMLADHRVHHSLRIALRYRACGNKAFDGTCDPAKLRWVEGALSLAETLRGKSHGRRIHSS